MKDLDKVRESIDWHYFNQEAKTLEKGDRNMLTFILRSVSEFGKARHGLDEIGIHCKLTFLDDGTEYNLEDLAIELSSSVTRAMEDGYGRLIIYTNDAAASREVILIMCDELGIDNYFIKNDSLGLV